MSLKSYPSRLLIFWGKFVFLKFIPLLVIYLFLVAKFSVDYFQADEGGYYEIANQIIKGTYFSNGIFWWGPGYPIILIPFILLNLPVFYAKLLNAFFLFGAILYFYRTVSLYLNKDRMAIILSYCLGGYPPLVREIYLLHTESLTFFLICGFIYHFCVLYKTEDDRGRRNQLITAAIYLGCLTLTKVFFGYVILVGLLLYGFLYAIKRNKAYLRTFLIYALSMTICVPYLVVTLTQTGRVFYWGTSGGMSLYWMSTPYKNELGDWFSYEDVINRQELIQHRDFFKEIFDLPADERDEAFKAKAVENIMQNPIKYMFNWVANIGRLFFSYPFSYTPQKLSTYYYLLPNMFIFVLLVISIYPAILRYRSIPFEIYGLILFALIALSGTSLVSAYDRQFRPLVPIFLLWISFVYYRVLQINIRPEAEI